MGKTNLRIDTRRALKDGTYPVQIKVGYGTNIYINTGIYLTPEEWDDRAQLCIGSRAKIINKILGQSLTRIINRLLELRSTGQYNNYTRAQLRQMLIDLSLDAPTVDVPTVADYTARQMEGRTGTTLSNYRYMLAKLNEYDDAAKLTMQDLTAAWWEGFDRHMRTTLKHNSVVAFLKCLKAVVRAAERDGATVNPAYRYIDVKSKETAMRNLTLEDLRKIRDAEMPEAHTPYRDAFMLSFYLIGINAADLLTLKKTDVVNGRVVYIRAKTGRRYSIKIEPEAQAILDKYATPAGDPRLLSFGGNKIGSFASAVIRALDNVVSGATWYYARYTWANLAIDLDVPKDIISEALGHNHGAAVTGVYIRYTLDKIDDANRKVLDYVANGDN